MLQSFFSLLAQINDFIWGYIAFVLIIFLGIYFTIKSKYFQIKNFPSILKLFFSSFKNEKNQEQGLNPFKTLFTAVSGSIGIGNIVGICTAIQLGGPGALFWTWVAGFLGMLLQYSEVYLGMLHRRPNESGGYDGGPMFFIPKAFKMKWTAIFASLLLCVYGVEIFMFNVITNSVSLNWQISKPLIVVLLLVIILLAVKGGVKRVSQICSYILPLFLGLYIFMILWVLANNFIQIPSIFLLIIKSAFTKQAAIGGFAGSTVMLTISMGLSRGAYAGDIGIGYNSVIHSETKWALPYKQASIAISGVFFNTFILCSLSTFIILVTNMWKEPVDVTMMIQLSLAKYFPYMHIFMPLFLFLLGYITIITYFVVGMKCAKFISKKKGAIFYYLYALISLPIFAFINASQAFIFMSFAGALLLIINLTAFFLLRKEISFTLDD